MKSLNVVAAALWISIAPLGAAVCDAKEKLPSGEQLMDRFVKSTGGKAAYRRIKNRVVKGKVTMPAMGMSMDIVEYAAAPSKHRSKMFAEMMGGAIERGITDGTAWEVNPMSGARLVDGDVADIMKRTAYFHKEVDWRDIFTEAKCVEETDFADTRCYKVVLKDGGGRETIYYFETDTGLLRGEELSMEGPMGAMTITSINKSYKEVDGILFPHKVLQTVKSGPMTQEMVIIVESIEHNTDISDDQFAPPEKVLVLLKAEREKPKADAKADAKADEKQP